MLLIPATLMQQLYAAALAAHPAEIVGILAGQQSVQELLPLENIAPQPSKEFVADPGGIALALKHLRTHHLELLAFYHSHPNGPAIPSRSDFEQASWDVPMLILDAKNQTARAWDLETGQEVNIVIF